jgi:glycosyltransferase involved in cell wall biosynthesis
LYLGNFGRSQDLRTLLRAAARLPGNLVWELHLAGGGENEEEIRALLGQLEIGSKVRVHGFLRGDALIDLVGRCHVGVNPVLPESGIVCPYKVGDYLCSGLPVLDGLGGELRGLLEQAGCGWGYPAGDSDYLAQLMERLIRSSQGIVLGSASWRDASRAAFRLAAQHFDRANTYPRLAQAVEQLVERQLN